jgi:hypothetical protein
MIRRALMAGAFAFLAASAAMLGLAPGALSGTISAIRRGEIDSINWTPAAEAARAPAHPLPEGICVPSYSPGPMPFHPGEQLVYQASWIGIPAAGGRILLRNNGDNDSGLLSAEIWISTNRLTDKFYRMRDYLREDFGAASLKPAEMNIRQNEARRHDTFRVSFDHRDHLVTLVKHGPRGTQVRKFLAKNPSGPVSGAIMALSQPLERGDVLKFDAFSGTTRYIFQLKVVKREKIGTPLGEFDAFRIVPSVTYLSDGKINDEVHDTTLWVSADARRLPLRVESAVFIGSVRIDLVKVVDGGTIQASSG